MKWVLFLNKQRTNLILITLSIYVLVNIVYIISVTLTFFIKPLMLTLIIYFFEIIKTVNAVCFFNAAESWQLELQDPVLPVFEEVIFFYNYLIFFLILTGSLVFWLLYVTIVYFNTYIRLNESQIFTHSSLLDIVCRIFFAIVLLIIAAPSLPKNLDVILFFIAAVCGLINSAHCDPDVDETFTLETL